MPEKTYRLKKEAEGTRDITVAGTPIEPPFTTSDPALQRDLDELYCLTDRPAPKATPKSSADKKENS